MASASPATSNRASLHAPVVTTLDAIATGTPSLRKPQDEAAAFMTQIESLSKPLRSRLPAVYRGSAIDARHSCIPDYGEDDPAAFDFFPATWTLEPAPSTAERNARYREAAVPLAEDVAQRALRQSGVASDDITHVIAVSCTGFFAPGLDVQIVKRLGLPPTTQRTMIGFMGCYAAFNALRVAHSFCQSHPDARVLVVCVELCTLHFQIEDTLESVVVNALFADGAAAAVLSARSGNDARGRLAYRGSRSVMDDDSEDAMTWTIGDTGFRMGLSPRVPDVIAEHLPGYTQGLLANHGLQHASVDAWAIHPGGRRIVERAKDVLALSDDDVATSLGILRDYGNMSSPTILFVLQRLLGWNTEATPGTNGASAAASDSQANASAFGAGRSASSGTLPNALVAMAFGPGLTIEGALFGRVGAGDLS